MLVVVLNNMDNKNEILKEIMLKNIDKNINSAFFMEMLRKNWEQTHHIGFLSNLIGELYIHHIINKDGYGFEDYMTQVAELYLQFGERKISVERFDLQRAKLISTIIASKLGIDIKNVTPENMVRVKNYFLQEYVANGYVSHSFPEAYFDSIMKNGLVSSAEARLDKPLDIQEIQDIFMSKGVMAPMGAYPFYGGSGIYYEHDFTRMFKHAIDSPEWFNWFTSADHTVTFHDGIEKSPYILRSEADCRRNVNDLCLNAGLNEEETKKVMDFYQKHYAKFSSAKLNVALIAKRTVGKDIITDAVSQNMDLFETINYVLNDGARQYTEHDGNVYAGDINPEDLSVSVIPDASKYIKAEQYQRETQEHLMSPDFNLAIIQNAYDNGNRLIPSIIPKLEKAKEIILRRKNLAWQYNGTIASYSTRDSSLTGFEKPAFDERTDNEIEIYNKIRQKNQIIKQRKAQKRDDDISRGRSLSYNLQDDGSNDSKGSMTSFMAILLIGFIIGALLIIIKLLIGR